MARPRANEAKNRPERVAFWVSKEIKQKLKAASSETRSMGDIANDALEQYFAKRRRSDRDKAA